VVTRKVRELESEVSHLHIPLVKYLCILFISSVQQIDEPHHKEYDKEITCQNEIGALILRKRKRFVGKWNIDFIGHTKGNTKYDWLSPPEVVLIAPPVHDCLREGVIL